MPVGQEAAQVPVDPPCSVGTSTSPTSQTWHSFGLLLHSRQLESVQGWQVPVPSSAPVAPVPAGHGL